MLIQMKFFLVLLLMASNSFFCAGSLAEELLKGLKYQKLNTALQQTIHVLEIDPQYFDLTAAHAKERAVGRETVTTIAKRHRAIAAINGGFFTSGESTEGLPAGILKIQGHWYGIAYRHRGAIGWSNKKNMVLIDRIQTKTSVYLNHHRFPIHSVNQPGLANKAILYTDAYGSHTDSLVGGYDIVIHHNRIIGFELAGKTAIPKGGYVYSIGPRVRYPHHPLEIGNTATVNIEVIPNMNKENYLAWQMVDNIIGGTPLLLYNRKAVTDYSTEKLRSPFIKERYARSAVGLLENGHWVFVVVERSALTGSPGMTITELTALMQELGAEYALNLDGGGSSTLFLDNAVINHPEGDDDEDNGWAILRPVSDAILVLPKKH
jgi:exopolysaccharide biosynthesis protein